MTFMNEWIHTLPDGTQVPISELSDSQVSNQANKIQRAMVRQTLRLLHFQREIHKRGLEHPRRVVNNDAFSIAHICMNMAVKSFNEIQERANSEPTVHIVHTSPPKCPECFGVGGLYVPTLGIDDDCPDCVGTGDAQ